MNTTLESEKSLSSAALAQKLAQTDFSRAAATVIGYGNMGREYVKALQALQVGRIRVISLSPEPLKTLAGIPGVVSQAEDYRAFSGRFDGEELGIVALPIADLIPAAHRLVELGCRRLLIEKPISLHSERIVKLDAFLKQAGVQAACAYNRAAYPSALEARFRAEAEGGVTSCTYTFTEFVDRLNLSLYTAEDLSRWGIANSLHVMSLAHRLIGAPQTWQTHRAGRLSWHPTGAVFIGSGLSNRGVPFGFHADWGSTGRWSVEIHTPVSSYRLCPLEKLYRRATATGEWEEVRLTVWASNVKAGFVEQVASRLDASLASLIPLWTLEETAHLTAFGEDLFGYSRS